jgi:hypothetical protein
MIKTWVVSLLFLLLVAPLAACGATPTSTADLEATVEAAVAATMATARGEAQPTALPSPRPTSAFLPGGQVTAGPESSPAAPAPTAARPTAPAPTVDTAAAMDDFARALAGQEPFTPPAARGGTVLTHINPFAHLFPELRALPAPDWLHEGVRVTYYGQSATISNVAGEDGAGGAGYLQCDLVALDGGAAVVSMKLYLDLGDGIVIPVLVLPSLGLNGVGDYWLHPDVLADAERVANDELIVARMPTTIGGRTYQAVRFEYRPEGAEYVWMYDQDSGLLLFYRHAIGEEDDARRQLTDVTLVGVREPDLPWAGGTTPDWVQEGGYLEYEGTYTALVMGEPAGSFDYALRADVEGAYPRWSAYLVTEVLAGRTSSISWRISGGAEILDAVWLSPEAVEALAGRRGTLDRDPITGETLTLSRGPGGRIVLTASNTAYEVVLTYDGSDGGLLRFSQQVTSGAAGTAVELELTGRK